MNRAVFMEKFGAVFEHSPWVAESVFDKCAGSMPADADALGEQFRSAFLGAAPELQLASLRAHPRLACALADPADLTTESANEQAGAGLDQCTQAELAEFGRLNSAYLEKFGYPFIVAVRGRDRHSILSLLRMRLQNDAVLEYQTALRQVCQIATFRIGDIMNA